MNIYINIDYLYSLSNACNLDFYFKQRNRVNLYINQSDFSQNHQYWNWYHYSFHYYFLLYFLLNLLNLLVRVLDHRRNNEGSMLLYNLAATKNSKMKIDTQDKSREKQKSPAKTILIVPELALKGNISKPDFKRD